MWTLHHLTTVLFFCHHPPKEYHNLTSHPSAVRSFIFIYNEGCCEARRVCSSLCLFYQPHSTSQRWEQVILHFLHKSLPAEKKLQATVSFNSIFRTGCSSIHLFIVREIRFFPERLVLGWWNWQHHALLVNDWRFRTLLWNDFTHCELITCACFIFNLREMPYEIKILQSDTSISRSHISLVWKILYCVLVW